MTYVDDKTRLTPDSRAALATYAGGGLSRVPLFRRRRPPSALLPSLDRVVGHEAPAAKASSAMNSEQMQLARYAMDPVEPSITDGAYAALLERRYALQQMQQRAQEAERYQALLQAARQQEREMVQYLADEAAAQRRLEHEEAIASVDPDDMTTEVLESIGALPPRHTKEASMYALQKYADRYTHRAKIAQVVDAALVGYGTPEGDVREAYLESTRPTLANRLQRAAMGGGAGLALGGLAGGIFAAAKGRGLKTPLLAGLGGGAAGAAGGFGLPTPVRTAYDPDYGTPLSEREERRMAAVHRALAAGDQPSNIALLGPEHKIRARPFGGARPDFAYAADIDDMVREDPAAAGALFGPKMSSDVQEEKTRWQHALRGATRATPVGMTAAALDLPLDLPSQNPLRAARHVATGGLAGAIAGGSVWAAFGPWRDRIRARRLAADAASDVKTSEALRRPFTAGSRRGDLVYEEVSPPGGTPTGRLRFEQTARHRRPETNRGRAVMAALGGVMGAALPLEHGGSARSVAKWGLGGAAAGVGLLELLRDRGTKVRNLAVGNPEILRSRFDRLTAFPD